ncbi:putative F-box/LRR-repeat protein 22 [Capsicum galapagoense]
MLQFCLYPETVIIRKPKGRVANKRKYESLLDLPDDLWENILMRLAAIERLTIAQQVCTTWRRVLKEPTMWHVIDMSNVRGLPDSKVVQHVCREGVDRSQGELVDIRIDFFATKELLVYVANRSPKLKRLCIAWCKEKMAPEDLVGVVKKLPLLEELSLTNTDITPKGIEALGLSCPRLKSFELNNICCSVKPGKCLEAILDGCPNLESLDLRGCFNVSLDKILSSRISKQIKDVKYPRDSLAGL